MADTAAAVRTSSDSHGGCVDRDPVVPAIDAGDSPSAQTRMTNDQTVAPHDSTARLMVPAGVTEPTTGADR